MEKGRSNAFFRRWREITSFLVSHGLRIIEKSLDKIWQTVPLLNSFFVIVAFFHVLLKYSNMMILLGIDKDVSDNHTFVHIETSKR